MMPAAKFFDPIMGVDVHMILPAVQPAPPVPIPHPFIGFFMDPMDLAPVIGATVFVNNQPRVQAGTGSSIPSIVMHFPIGGTFVKPVGNEGEAFMGSATVLVEDEPFTYLGNPVLSCSCIGMPPPPRKKSKGAPGLMMPTSTVTPIPMGMPVLIGGPPTISMMGMAMKFGMAGLGKGLGGLKKMQKKSKMMKKVSDKIHKAANKVMDKLGIPPSVRNKVHKSICSVTGHPVDIATGKVFTDNIDFELPGPIPLQWERVYFSTSAYDGPIGYGWHHSYDMALYYEPSENMVMLRLGDGRITGFPMLENNTEHYNRQEKLTLSYSQNQYTLRTEDDLSYHFTVVGNKRDVYSLTAITDRNGHRVQFHYDTNGHLIRIIDSAARILTIVNNAQGKIKEIYAPHPDYKDRQFKLLSYEYDYAGNLIKMSDAHEQSFTFKYMGHLMIQETNRVGLSFYFEYDGTDENARCLRTWGDEGIYDHKLEYYPDGMITIVENSLGAKTQHMYNDDGVVVEVTDAMGNVSKTLYNEHCEVVEEIDNLGASTKYEYDGRGNRTEVIQPDGTKVSFEYDSRDQLLSATDEIGSTTAWGYDDKGNIAIRIDCLGRETSYAYASGMLTKVTMPDGTETKLTYDNQFNLSSLETADGAKSTLAFDYLGRCTAIVDPRGNMQQRRFDLMGRVIRVDEPDGNIREMRYDGEGNVLHAKDRQHNVQFTYRGMNRLASRTEAGTTVEFVYDTEDQLIAIQNEHGSVYGFKLDPLGNVMQETGFDRLIRTYDRDAEGRVVKVNRPLGQFSEYEYDDAGQVIKVKHHDDSEELFEYREDGELLVAQNAHQKIQFEKDALGQILKEIQGAHEVISQYDVMGRRIKIQSSLGANIDIARNMMGDAEKVSVGNRNGSAWTATMERDIMGLELVRTLPGGMQSITKRDKLGRPVHHRIAGKKAVHVDRQYVWDVNDRLRKIIDAKQGTTTFTHDDLGNLSGATYGDGSVEYRMPDSVGNLFRTAERSDRKYGPAGQLLESNGTRFYYDVEGNLINKVEKDGSQWHYRWNAQGMLEKVVRPDGMEVSFIYDALGRRTSKTFGHRTTYWVWDGNVPLHEWTEGEVLEEGVVQMKPRIEYRVTGRNVMSEAPANAPPTGITTWVFEPESFSPMAKLKDGKQYSIVTDYLGTPTCMLGEAGEKIWSATTSIYGKLRTLEGDRNACPFRYPGQYEDEETGLYYNRFRYYDPEDGLYVSQDPIGLEGGNPTLYGYVSDSNMMVDELGLLTYNTMPGKTNYQKHHIIPQQLKNHDALQKAGYNIHDSSNVKYLPKKSGIDSNTNLAIHNGSHPKYTAAVQSDLDKIAKKGKANNWTQAQYKAKVEKVVNKYDKKLTNGKIKCK